MNIEELAKEHAQWSEETFGAVSHKGPMEHLREEALEAKENPVVGEFADCLALVLDGSRRAGHSLDDLLIAFEEKLKVNKLREWPKAIEGQPCNHLKEVSKEPIAHNIGTAYCEVGESAHFGAHFFSDSGTINTNCAGPEMQFNIAIYLNLDAIELRHPKTGLAAKILLKPLLENSARRLAEAVELKRKREAAE